MIKVLLLEDNPGDQLLISEALRESKLMKELIAFEDGETLLENIQNGNILKERPELFLLDINLPKVNGFEILQTLKGPNSPFKHSPIIMLSTSSFDYDIEKAYGYGASGYMVKSSEFSDLKEKIYCLLRYWIETTEVPPLDLN